MPAGGTDTLRFDKNDVERYEAEAREKWGNCSAFKEYEEKKTNKVRDGEKLMSLIKEVGDLRDLPPEDERVRVAVGKIKSHINDRFYTCDDDRFLSLGMMYVEDPRFKENIDGYAGEGSAEFVSKAISAYCSKK